MSQSTPRSSTQNQNPKSEPDALDTLVGDIIERDPGFADEWAAFAAALDLRMKRKASGLSQADVGERLGIDQSGVARIERDPSGVSLDKFRRYAAAIGYRVELVPIKRPARTKSLG